MRYQIDNLDCLEQAYHTSKFIQCPNKIKADEFILEFFRRHPEQTLIISNDNFSEYEIDNLALFKFTIFFNEVIIKPDLEEALTLTKHSSREERTLAEAF